VTAAGWFLMLVSCGTVTGVTVFCYWRLLRGGKHLDNEMQSTEGERS
jgi:hypothetical protein